MDVVFIKELNSIIAVGGERKGITDDGMKDPPSKAIDLLDLDTMTIASGQLQSKTDEPSLAIRKINASEGKAELIVIQGVGPDHQATPAEKIAIAKQ